MTLQPLADRVIVLPAPKEKVTEGGIIIPDTVSSKNPLAKGTLVSKGPEVVSDLAVGSDVLYAAGAGSEVQIDGKIHLMLHISHVWAYQTETV